MGYDFDLCDPVTGETLHTDNHQIAGGVIAIGGTTRMWLKVTYNYSSFFDFRGLEGKSGAESIPLLKAGIARLKDDVDDDYWKATEGNAKRALNGLLAFAQLRPDGVWRVS